MERTSLRNGATLNLDQISQAVMARLAQIETSDDEAPEPVRRNGRLELTVPIGISVRHLHLSDEHLAILFGKGHSLTVFNELYQTGYFAAKEQVMVVGRRRAIETVRVLGPTRPYSQVELAQTEALQLGLKLPIATDGSDPACKPITLMGPEGVVTLPGGGKGGAFIARRHVHMSDLAARHYGVKNGDLLDLFIDGARPTTLHGVLVRVKAGWRNEVHLDTDEGNAVGIRNGQTGTLVIPIK